MSAPLAYFISWTTYGTRLHGDSRGWVDADSEGIHPSDPAVLAEREEKLSDEPFIMDAIQRAIVDQAIRDHCAFRKWTIHALNMRTNHVHIVVTAECPPEKVMQELKTWTTRRLKPHIPRARYWTKHGSTKWINDTTYLHNAINYVDNEQ